jgi:hypothetical protein
VIGTLVPRLGGDQDVRRLDVAVHEPARMRSVKRTRDLGDESERALRGERTIVQERLQVAVLDVPHRDEDQTVGLACGIDRNDVRMVEAGRQLGLGQQALPETRVFCELGREQLERNLALQPQILGQIDDPHTAAAEDVLDPVAEELAAHVQLGRRRHVAPNQATITLRGTRMQ